MEPWMCPMDSGGLQDTYGAITNLDHRFGVATEQSLIHGYQTNWITTFDLNNITNGGFNCVRVPVWWGNFYSITNTASSGWRSDAFSVLDWVVTNCQARGIYVIIDMHGVIGGQGTPSTPASKIKSILVSGRTRARPPTCGAKSQLITKATSRWPVTI